MLPKKSNKIPVVKGTAVKKQSGRQTGAKGYQKKVLYACVKQHLTLCIEEWRDIAAIYQARSGEELVRDAASIRTHCGLTTVQHRTGCAVWDTICSFVLCFFLTFNQSIVSFGFCL